MSVSNTIVCEPSLAVYFRDRLTEYSAAYRPPPQEDTLWYLSDMLARFGQSDQVFSYEEGSLTLRPLAMLYSDANEAPTAHHRQLILRKLGDLALFLGALFPENFTRRGIEKDYLVGMGGAAYSYLSSSSGRHQHIFSELSATFTRILELVSQACSKENFFDATDIFNMYQRWRETRDPLLKTQLEAIGISLQENDFLQ